MTTPAHSRCWDLFCTVIDNYGDIGITWRLARQLALEHDMTVRLWVDDLASFAMLRPEIDPSRTQQTLEGVIICRWTAPFPDTGAADVVIEAFACELPAHYVAAMAARKTPPVWINLEYLSAEDWVEGCHGLPSPHPRLPLTKYFFFPGYTARTGGLLRETWLLRERAVFQASPAMQSAFWQQLGLAVMPEDGIRVSLFGYENKAVSRLLADWSRHATPVTCLFPIGRLQDAIGVYFDAPHVEPGLTFTQGQLTLHVLPMLNHDQYDRLLWSCDCNFVRGEDSFVRAQWAMRPLVWQAYRQEESAHEPKIAAFLNRYTEGMDIEAARALRAFWTAWNSENGDILDWPGFWKHQADYDQHALGWSDLLVSHGDLASNLVKFCNKKL